MDRFLGRNRENFFQLSMHRRNIRVWQVDLVNHRHNREALFVREMNVRNRLCFNALRGIDNQERAFARRKGARNFVGKIDVARRVEQIQPVSLPVLRAILHRYRMRFDRDPAFALKIHRIEQLVLLLTLVNSSRALEQSVRQRRFAVIDVRDDAEIARVLDSHESRTMQGVSSLVIPSRQR